MRTYGILQIIPAGLRSTSAPVSLYGASAFVLLRIFAGFNQSEFVAAYVIPGLVFPALVWQCTLRARTWSLAVRDPEIESLILIAYLFVLALRIRLFF